MATQMKTLPVQIIGARRITVPKSLIQVIINIEHLSLKFSSQGQGDIDEDGLGDECDDDKDNDGIKLLEKKEGCSKNKAKKVKKEYIKSDCIQETTGHSCDQVTMMKELKLYRNICL